MIGLPEPAALAEVPASELPAVLVQLSALQAAVAARLVAVNSQHDGEPHVDGDHLLGIEAAGERLAVTHDWLRRRPTLPFVVKLSEGVVRYSAAGIARFIAERRQQD